MTSSSSEAVAPAYQRRELRAGTWTRLGAKLGDHTVLGDAVTEELLSGLVEETRAAARAQGYATGWAEGRRAAQEQSAHESQELAARSAAAEARREQEHRAAVAALVRATERLQQATAEVCARVEAQAVETAVRLTEELVGHELAVAETPALDAVRRALQLAPGEPVVRILVSPEEAAKPQLREVAGAAAVVPDPSLRRGEVVVETDTGVVDARVWGAMERVREVLVR